MGWEYKIYFSNDFISLKKWDDVNNNLVDTQKRQTHEVSVWLNDVWERVPSHYLKSTPIPTGTASVGFVVSGRVHKVGYLLSPWAGLGSWSPNWKRYSFLEGPVSLMCFVSCSSRCASPLGFYRIFMSLELWFRDCPKSPLKQLTLTTSLDLVV